MTEAQSTSTTSARFVTGSTMRHVVVMTVTSSVGLVALFLVDFADMYFISLLGEIEVAAAIGYAGSILFFNVSIGIGLAIAASALVARAIGADDRAGAKRLCTNSLIYSAVIAAILATLLWLFVPAILSLLGAEGRAHALATNYLRIIVPTMPALTLGICGGAILRALGDPKRAMYVTLSGGLVNAVLDPILIFGAGLGLDGAAIASVCARLAVMCVGLYGVIRVHKMIDKPVYSLLWLDTPAISAIAAPAVLTNVATPVGNAYVTSVIAQFGDGPVAGWAVVGRIIPVAFGVVFALSGAVGPILGQNLGAHQYGRLRQSLSDSLLFAFIYVAVAWAILALGHEYISAFFGLSGPAAELVGLFCTWLSPTFLFFGALFVASAAFNNLGRPHYSTAFAWARATLGTIPFVYFGGQWYGATGALTGYMLGSVVVGGLAVAACYQLIATLAHAHAGPDATAVPLQRRWPLWPFSTPGD